MTAESVREADLAAEAYAMLLEVPTNRRTPQFSEVLAWLLPMFEGIMLAEPMLSCGHPGLPTDNYCGTCGARIDGGGA